MSYHYPTKKYLESIPVTNYMIQNLLMSKKPDEIGWGLHCLKNEMNIPRDDFHKFLIGYMWYVYGFHKKPVSWEWDGDDILISRNEKYQVPL